MVRVWGGRFLFFFFLTKLAPISSMLNSPYGINRVSTFGFSSIPWEGVWLCEKVLVELAAR